MAAVAAQQQGAALTMHEADEEAVVAAAEPMKRDAAAAGVEVEVLTLRDGAGAAVALTSRLLPEGQADVKALDPGQVLRARQVRWRLVPVAGRL